MSTEMNPLEGLRSAMATSRASRARQIADIDASIARLEEEHRDISDALQTARGVKLALVTEYDEDDARTRYGRNVDFHEGTSTWRWTCGICGTQKHGYSHTDAAIAYLSAHRENCS